MPAVLKKTDNKLIAYLFAEIIIYNVSGLFYSNQRNIFIKSILLHLFRVNTTTISIN